MTRKEIQMARLNVVGMTMVGLLVGMALGVQLATIRLHTAARPALTLAGSWQATYPGGERCPSDWTLYEDGRMFTSSWPKEGLITSWHADRDWFETTAMPGGKWQIVRQSEGIITLVRPFRDGQTSTITLKREGRAGV